jgi:Beta protein
MLPLHTAILRANKGELEALRNLGEQTADKVWPLFEVGRLTDAIRRRKYISTSSTPIMAYLNRVLGPVADTWLHRPCMVDGFHWPADARTENGDHVIAYMVSRLRASGASVTPVVGYDRWSDPDYRLGLQSIEPRDDGHYCLRLDSSAIEDAAEPEHFRNNIQDILDALELDPTRCSALLDFEDISMGIMSIEALAARAGDVIRLLQAFRFKQYIVAGCSLPATINLAVHDQDSEGSLLRKEILVWQILRLEFPGITIVSGDYGVRGPTTTENPSKYTNGKIRHTVKKQIFVVRGHPFTYDHNYAQMYGLATSIVKSRYFLGEHFSWGDSQIFLASRYVGGLGLTRWIAIDTNHHLTFVVQEVEEFEREAATAKVPTSKPPGA